MKLKLAFSVILHVEGFTLAFVRSVYYKEVPSYLTLSIIYVCLWKVDRGNHILCCQRVFIS